jgi:VWFA-related protein
VKPQRRHPVVRVVTSLVSVLASAVVLAQNPPPASARGPQSSSGAASPQEQTPPQQPVFRAGTMLVPIDVRVIDKEGKPVTDLTQKDFTILEDRQPQRVAHFWTQGLEAVAPAGGLAPLERNPDARMVGPQARRIFLIVLGRGRLQPPAKGVDGVIHLVRERLLPQDYVAVLAWNRATEFTTDHTKVAEVLERFKKSHEDIESLLRQQFSGLAAVYGGTKINAAAQKRIDTVFDGPGVPARTMAGTDSPDQSRMGRDQRQITDALITGAIAAGRTGADPADVVDPIEAMGLGAMSFDEYVETNMQSMQDLSRLYSGINYLRQIDGEKHLLFLSERGILLPRAEDDQSLAAVASDARVVIDIIHTGGVPLAMGRGGRGGAIAPDPSTPWKIAMARTVTEHTGGSFTGTTSATKAIDAIDAATRFQYVLGYYTSNTTLDGRYRRVIVRVNRPGLTVLYRHGYYARRELPPLERRQVFTQTRIAAAGSFDGVVPDIKVTATARPATQDTGLGVAVDVTIDASRVTFKQVDGRHTGSLDVTVFCGDARENLVGQSTQQMNFKLLDELHRRFLTDGIPYSVRVPVRAPATYVKVVVYDYAADLLGSAVVKLNVK